MLLFPHNIHSGLQVIDKPVDEMVLEQN